MIRGLTQMIAMCALAGAASATVLTFDITGFSNFSNMDDGYGDFVSSLTDGDFSYAEAGEGLTPNVEVHYSRGPADPAWWSTGYGDLTNVLFEDTDTIGQMEITFTADPGYAVVLYSWDMAAYSSAFGSDPTINRVLVTNGVGCDRFRLEDASISRSTRTSFDFSDNPIQGRVIRLTFDSANLGGLSDDIGIDNIRFGQAADDTCHADIAPTGAPDGRLDIDDVLLFLNAFASGSPIADVAAPCGEYNIDDVLTYLSTFSLGCGG